MCAELLRHVDAQPDLIRWRQGRCLPYGDGIAFWALGEIVKAECGILESDTPAEVAAKLEQAVAAGRPRAGLAARPARHRSSGRPAEPVSQEESFAAWRRFCEGLAAERTTVLDLRGSALGRPGAARLSRASGRLGGGRAAAAPLHRTARAVRAASRPSAPTPGTRSAINLAPLSDAETAQLVSALLERAVLPAETQQQLLEQAGGNPLYAEEFVRLLADRGRLGDGRRGTRVGAGADRRPPRHAACRIGRACSRTPSVLGKVFWAGALAAMGGRDRARGRAGAARAGAQGARPSRPRQLDGGRARVRLLARARARRLLRADPARRPRRPPPGGRRLDRGEGRRAGRGPRRRARPPLPGRARAERRRPASAGSDEPAGAGRSLSSTLAGERTLSLDVEQAERQLARALELCPDDAPERAVAARALGAGRPAAGPAAGGESR